MLGNEIKLIFNESSLQQLQDSNSKNIPLVLCGDFISLPDSGVIDFLLNGTVPSVHKDFKGMDYKSSLIKILRATEKYKYKFI